MKDSNIGAATGKDVRILGGSERHRRLYDRKYGEFKLQRMKHDERMVWNGRMDHFRVLVRMLNESMGLCLR